ncbi:hypothetical protein BGZ79_003150 [Entomortierella chlamydospora]|nr:hypothetical protein BGZ79_003150 [Entomortierella chlamydospora]
MRRVSDPVIKDHRELEEYYNNILNATTDDEKTRWQNQFVWELARHSAGEEIVIYPAMEEELTNGKELADNDRQEHQKVKELLHKFQGMNATDSAFSPTLRQLWADLSEHIKHEEEEDLVRLEEALSAAKSAEMAKSFQRTKMFVPTHAHPSAPDKPPFETVVGLMTAPIDKLLDVFHRFPKGEQ